MRTLLVITLLSLCLLACKSKSDKNTDNGVIEVKKSNATSDQQINIVLNAKNESNVSGKVRFVETDGVVEMTALVSGLTQGVHAIHIHEKSDCSSADGKSAGGHWNPSAQPHGKWGADTGFHKGDIGNFVVSEEQYTTVQFSTNEWCIGCGDASKDILGKSVIIHQGEDDFVSQPSGAAGSRISCAGIIE